MFEYRSQRNFKSALYDYSQTLCLSEESLDRDYFERLYRAFRSVKYNVSDFIIERFMRQVGLTFFNKMERLLLF